MKIEVTWRSGFVEKYELPEYKKVLERTIRHLDTLNNIIAYKICKRNNQIIHEVDRKNPPKKKTTKKRRKSKEVSNE